MGDLFEAKQRARLSLLKQPEIGERDEGYDGHYEWDLEEKDSFFLDLLNNFQFAVRSRKFDDVLQVLSALVSGGDDGRLNTISRLLTLTKSEEALKEALLIAITIGSRPLVEFILTLYDTNPYHERTGCSGSKNFAPHMTPLMLACILNNFSIVQCLLLRGHSIQIPHFRKCECEDCKRITISSRENVRHIDVMRAVTSEAFLWLATDDVLASCWSIVKDLQRLIQEDNRDFVQTYTQLESNVQNFMTRVGDMAWRYEEFNTLVANKNHCLKKVCEMKAPRLQMARFSRMRQFTCSPNVQTTMTSLFRDDWFNYGNRPKRDIWRVCRASIFLPFTLIGFIILPKTFDTLHIPMARFFAHLATFSFFFICVISWPFVQSFDPKMFFADLIEIYLYVYILGLAIEKGLLLIRIGVDLYFSYWWRYFDIFLIFSFTFSFIFFIGAKTDFAQFDQTEIDRLHWPVTHPALLHEVFFAISCLLAISKIFYYMQLMKLLGGSVISVGNCVGKVYTYIILILVVMFSFSVGFNVLVVPYINRKALKLDGTIDDKTTESYNDIPTSTKNLFWSIFGYLGPSTYRTVVGNAGPTYTQIHHPANSATLELLGALFHGIIIITLLNLMTSLLVKKADEVLDNEELEFKYTRAAIYSEFLSWETAAPPPFNLILLPINKLRRLLTRNTRRTEPDSLMYQLKGEPSQNLINSQTIDRFDEQKDMAEMNKTTAQKERENERIKLDKILITMFDRFCASKECKYKSVFRSEFDKEERFASRVAFLEKVALPFSLDNTYVRPKAVVNKSKEEEARNSAKKTVPFLVFMLLITFVGTFPHDRTTGFDRLRDRIHRKRHRHQKASILNESDDLFDQNTSSDVFADDSSATGRASRAEKSLPTTSTFPPSSSTPASVIHQRIHHHHHHHHHHHRKKNAKNRREKNEELCLSKRTTVELNTHSHEFNPPFIVEVRCLNTPSAISFHHSTEQTCFNGMLRCVQQYSDVHVSRRSVGSMHWHPFTFSDIPISCQCMWPVDKYGHQEL